MRGSSLIGIVVAMFFVAVLVLLYMRTMMPSPPEMKGQIGAIEKSRDAAAAFEAQQKAYQQNLQKQLEE